jgi:colanic acid/amylovoran biosynthesis glycosyltransferase
LSEKLLLVLPIRAYRHQSQIFVDAQARNGLRLWLGNFDTLTLACPTTNNIPPAHHLPIDDDRINFVSLPVAYSPHRFAIALYRTWPMLRKIIASSDHLHFAIGGLFGDWASACAVIAHRDDRPFAVWTDRVESQVAAFQAKSKGGLKKAYYTALASLTKLYEQHIIQLSTLGLFHGMDCYTAYMPYSRNPQLVHDIHLSREDQISDLDIDVRLKYSGPVRIAYAGRVHRDKGVFDWIEALSLMAKDGIDFRATWFGDGPELENARRASEHLSNRIHFPGPTSSHPELIDKLRSFDLFMFCHKTQESPRCLIEALISGLPLMGYDSPYPRDLIKKHGGGILSPTGRPELLAASIRNFSEQRAAFTKKAQLDGKGFDADSVFRHRSDLMKSLISR